MTVPKTSQYGTLTDATTPDDVDSKEQVVAKTHASFAASPRASVQSFWNIGQLALFLGVPISWIYDRTCADAGDPIPHHKLGKYLRFDPNSPAFTAWLSRHEAGPVTNRSNGNK